MAKLVLQAISVREASPAAIVGLATRNRIPLITVFTVPMKQLSGNAVPFGDLPDWDLIGDTPNRRELKRLCEGEGVAIHSTDSFILRADTDLEKFKPAFETSAWLGAPRLTTAALGEDIAPMAEKVAAFCDSAREYGLDCILEYSPRMVVKTAAEWVRFSKLVDRSNLKIAVDCLHTFRGNTNLEDVAALDPKIIARFELCDGPLQEPPEGGGYEAFYERMIPGEGAFPLKDYVAVMPADVCIGLEVPLWRFQQAGMEPSERVARMAAASRSLLGGLLD